MLILSHSKQNFKYFLLNTDYNYLSGTVYASTWTSSSILGYASTSLNYSLVYTTRELASSFLNLLLNELEDTLIEIGTNLSDLGFSNY